MRNLFARNKDIYLPGAVRFEGTVKAKENLVIGTLFPSRPVFNYNLTEIAKDTVFRYNKNPKVTGKKTFKNNLNIRNLKTAGEFGNLSQVPDDGILKLHLHEKDFLATVLQAKNVHINGEINGVPATQFGNLWLTMEGDQVFLKPQTFQDLNADKIVLYGQMEERGVKYDISNALRDTYLINRKETCTSKAVFGGNINLFKFVIFNLFTRID